MWPDPSHAPDPAPCHSALKPTSTHSSFWAYLRAPRPSKWSYQLVRPSQSHHRSRDHQGIMHCEKPHIARNRDPTHARHLLIAFSCNHAMLRLLTQSGWSQTISFTTRQHISPRHRRRYSLSTVRSLPHLRSLTPSNWVLLCTCQAILGEGGGSTPLVLTRVRCPPIP